MSAASARDSHRWSSKEEGKGGRALLELNLGWRRGTARREEVSEWEGHHLGLYRMEGRSRGGAPLDVWRNRSQRHEKEKLMENP